MQETLTNRKNDRIASVEFWRFFFTVLVCLYHLEIWYSKGKLFPSGTSAVEFFFLLSGFLAALSASRRFGERQAAPGEACALATNWVWQKVKAIFPVLLITLIVYVLLNGAGYRRTWLENALNLEWELLFMVGTPFGYGKGFVPIVPLWFLTALFIGGYVYVYLLARNFHFTLYLAPLAGVVLYAYFTLNSALVLDFNVKMGLLTAGTVKAFAEMGLGIALFRLWDRLREREWRLPGRLLLTLLLLFSLYRYFALTVNAAVGFDNFKRIIYIMLILLLAFLNGDWIDRLLNHGFSRFLGGLSMTMYVSHFTFTTLYFMLLTALQKRLPGSEFLKGLGGVNSVGAWGGKTIGWQTRVIYMAFILVIAILLNLLVKLLKKLLKKPARKNPDCPPETPVV